MIYATIDSQYNVQQQTIESCGDYFYCLFGRAYRDFVRQAHDKITRVIQPEFNQMLEEPFNSNLPVLEAMQGRITALNELVNEARAFQNALENFEMDFEWENWSDLINPIFWFHALIYGVYTIAIKVWNWAGASQEILDMNAKIQSMYSEANSIEQDVGLYAQDEKQLPVKVIVKPRITSEFLHMYIQIGGVELKVQYILYSNQAIHYGLPPSEEGVRAMATGAPSLLIEFDERYKAIDTYKAQGQIDEAFRTQLSVAVELMIREDVDNLIVAGVSVEKNTYLKNFNFIQLAQQADNLGHRWLLTKDKLKETRKIAYSDRPLSERLLRDDKFIVQDIESWNRYFQDMEAKSSFKGLPKGLRFFPEI